MPESEDEIWRSLVNGLRDGDLPADGLAAPEIETLPKLPKGTTAPRQKVYVQKIVTEVYVYTDIAQQAFGQQVFQTSYQLGEMSAQKLMGILEKERRKKNK